MDQLETLLNDLQNTAYTLRQTRLAQQDHRFRPSSSPDKEPIYEPQNIGRNSLDFADSASKGTAEMASATAAFAENGLQDLEQLLDDYSTHRGRANGRPTVESLLGELDNAVPTRDSQKQPMSASTASRDLDNLMTSLAEFKVNTRRTTTTSTTTTTTEKRPAPLSTTVQHIEAFSGPLQAASTTAPAPETPKPSSDTAQLDSILGSLSDDLSKHGIATIPKGDCAACHKTIVGQVVIALGRMWHPEHFTCSHCNDELGHKNFFERSGCAYCETDYHNLFSPRCAYCNGPIKDKCVTALEKTWHPEHFFCATCGKEFGDDGFHEKDGRAFCRNDFFSAFAPRCRGCKRAITNNYITALNHQWHPDCFVCQECRQPFSSGSFFDHDDQPFCETHYHEKRGSLCASCQQPIRGKCITAMGKKFHPEHFVCSFCLQQLNKGTFKEHESKPYCHRCFAKLLQ